MEKLVKIIFEIIFIVAACALVGWGLTGLLGITFKAAFVSMLLITAGIGCYVAAIGIGNDW